MAGALATGAAALLVAATGTVVLAIEAGGALVSASGSLGPSGALFVVLGLVGLAAPALALLCLVVGSALVRPRRPHDVTFQAVVRLVRFKAVRR